MFCYTPSSLPNTHSLQYPHLFYAIYYSYTWCSSASLCTHTHLSMFSPSSSLAHLPVLFPSFFSFLFLLSLISRFTRISHLGFSSHQAPVSGHANRISLTHTQLNCTTHLTHVQPLTLTISLHQTSQHHHLCITSWNRKGRSRSCMCILYYNAGWVVVGGGPIPKPRGIFRRKRGNCSLRS